MVLKMGMGSSTLPYHFPKRLQTGTVISIGVGAGDPSFFSSPNLHRSVDQYLQSNGFSIAEKIVRLGSLFCSL